MVAAEEFPLEQPDVGMAESHSEPEWGNVEKSLLQSDGENLALRHEAEQQANQVEWMKRDMAMMVQKLAEANLREEQW